MICRYCTKEIMDGSIFCSFCGERVARKKKAKKAEIKIPTPRQLKSGALNIELRAERRSVTEASKSLCEAKARAIRAGFVEREKKSPALTVGKIVDDYISSKSNVLSPSTLRGYKSYRRNHITEIEAEDASVFRWQNWVNKKAATHSPKTISNMWRLITGSLSFAGIAVPSLTLPAVPPPDEKFLDYKQIRIFVETVRGTNVEFAALLALHSLRRSEIMALTPNSFDKEKKIIRVRGSRVQGADNSLVYKRANKSDTSTRDISIMIPRLLELIPDSGENFIVDCHPNRITGRLVVVA